MKRIIESEVTKNNLPDSSFDDKTIRDTIRLLHRELTSLFYLDDQYSVDIFNQINNSIVNCTSYGISSCIDVIISPIIMVIHNYIKELSSIEQNICKNSSRSQKDIFLSPQKKIKIEELLKILYNVLEKINEANHKMISSRLSAIFFDILLPITQIINFFLIKEDEFVLELCINIVKLDFHLFWKYWKYEKNELNGRYLVIPIILQYMLSIALPSIVTCKKPRIKRKFSNKIRKTTLQLLLKIPNIINDINLLFKVYPGTIQALGVEILNANIENKSFEILELSLLAFIEWITHCLSNENYEFVKLDTKRVCTTNTGKILEQIIKLKPSEFMFYHSYTNLHKNIYIYESHYIIRMLFCKIAFICLNESIKNFYEYSNETLTLCFDFLISMKCDKNSFVMKTVDEYLNILFNNPNLIQKKFLKNYFDSFSIGFNLFNFGNPNKEEQYQIYIDDLIHSTSKLIGTLYLGIQFSEFKLCNLDIDSILNSLFGIIISDISFNNYQKSVESFKWIEDQIKLNSLSIEIQEEISMEVDTVTNIVEKMYSEPLELKVNTDNEPIQHKDIDIFQVFNEILISLLHLKSYKVEFYDLKSIANLILNAISISILNLNDKMIQHQNIVNLFENQFSKLNGLKSEPIDFFKDFIIYFSICNSTQILLNIIESGNSSIERYLGRFAEISDLLLNWFKVSTQRLLELEQIDSKYKVNKEINNVILLILIGNIVKLAQCLRIENDCFFRKLNIIITILFSNFYSRMSIKRNSAKYVLSQFASLLGYSKNCENPIQILSKKYSIEILRSLEVMLYNGNFQKNIDFVLNSLKNSQMEFIFEISDIIDHFNEMNFKNNTWIFKFVQVISKRLSAQVQSIRNDLISRWISENNLNLVDIKNKIDVFFPNINKKLKQILFTMVVETNLFLENQLFNCKTTKIPTSEHEIPGSTERVEKDSMYFKKETKIDSELIKMRSIANKIIPIIYIFSTNIDSQKYIIFDYQYSSSAALLNCIIVLSTDIQTLFPHADKIISHVIDPWITIVNTFINNKFRFCNQLISNLRELQIINCILAQLIASCGSFVITKLEDKLIPLILLLLENIFKICGRETFMDDKEARSSAEIYKLSLYATELILFFTKHYVRQSMTEMKFETVNKIIKTLLSPKMNIFALELRIVAMKTLVCVYKTHPYLLRAYLKTVKGENFNFYIQEISLLINLIDKSSFFKNFGMHFVANFFNKTQGETLLQTKLNNIN